MIRSERIALTVLALSGFIAARALDLVFLLWQAASHPGTSLSGELTAWDGGWYRRVASSGYPSVVLTRAHNGHLAKSAYAFFPAYPMLVRWVSEATHFGFTTTAVVLNLGFGAGAAVGVAVVVRPSLGAGIAGAASVFWSFLPTAPILMMAYSEALFCLEVTVFFILLARRRYAGLAVLLPLLGLTRGVVVPLTVVLCAHLVVRLREALPGRDRLRAAAVPAGLIVFAGVCDVLWPAYVGWRAGRWDAYLQVQDAWVKGVHIHPSWWHAVSYVSHATRPITWLIVAAAVVALLVCLLALLTPLSLELKTFGLAYLLFLFAFTPIWSSFFRYLLPVFTLPAVGAVAARSIWARFAVLVVLAGLQYWWIDHFVANFPNASATP